MWSGWSRHGLDRRTRRTARSFVVDVSDEAQVQALVDDVVTVEGGLDVVFANAGIASVPGFAVEGGQRSETVERSDWDKVLGVNLNGVLFTMKHAAAVMKRQGSGRIVRHRPRRGSPSGTDRLLRIRREQGRDPEPRPAGGARASAARRARERDLSRPVQGNADRRRRDREPDEATEAQVGDDGSDRSHGADRGAQGAGPASASPASSFMTGAAYLIDGGTLVLAGTS